MEQIVTLLPDRRMPATSYLLLACACVCGIAQVANGELRCNSPLRILYPAFFSHCECTYNEWSEWEHVDGSRAVDRSCSTGESFARTRTRQSFGSGCKNSDTDRKCVPTRAEMLISGLGLGQDGTQNLESLGSNSGHVNVGQTNDVYSQSLGSQSVSGGSLSGQSYYSQSGSFSVSGGTQTGSVGQTAVGSVSVSGIPIPPIARPTQQTPTTPTPRSYVANPFYRTKRQLSSVRATGTPPTPPPDDGIPRRCPDSGGAGEICTDLYQPRGRRSLAREEYFGQSSGKGNNKRNKTMAPEDSKPKPFVWKDDHELFRRQVRSCESQDIQYILFLLDTSGSISNADFQRMTTAIGTITTLYCKRIQIAVMTFDHKFVLEFCFNCFDNNLFGRQSMSTTIKNVKHRRGLTHTAGATQCACTNLLHQSCGLPSSASCIDIVFITDGHSNDPNLEICREIQCLHSRGDVNTFAMGIGNYDNAEIQCIAQSSNDFNVFEFDSFAEFEVVLREVVELLLLSNGQYSCLNGNGLPDNKK